VSDPDHDVSPRMALKLPILGGWQQTRHGQLDIYIQQSAAELLNNSPELLHRIP
jgi:hypothetical protein